jgi:hypothetical protein
MNNSQVAIAAVAGNSGAVTVTGEPLIRTLFAFRRAEHHIPELPRRHRRRFTTPAGIHEVDKAIAETHGIIRVLKRVGTYAPLFT